MIRVLLVDDHAAIRQGLKQILAEAISVASIEEAGSAAEALARVRASTFDIIILDISLPGRSGLDVLKEIKQIRPDLPVLVLSVYREEEFAVRAVRAGAAGYVMKETASTELLEAVRSVAGGGRYVARVLAEKFIAESLRGSDAPPHERLSDSEDQLFRILA